MSKTDSLHYQLCCEAAKWLKRRKNAERWRTPWKYIAVELVCSAAENADVWATNGECSIVIEVKTSRADFLKDGKKWHRSEAMKDCQSGNFRYYLAPAGKIRKDELPEGWGLLEWDGKTITRVTPSKYRTVNNLADLIIMSSILRREGFPEKIFNYRGAPTTIHPKQ